MDLRQGACKIYFIGIKGTGMCALAELLQRKGVNVLGSDGAEVFYTDAILKELLIPYHETFDPSHIDKSIDMIIYSAAYSFGSNSEMDEGQKLGIPMLKYPDALGEYSRGADSSGICGVHGKTSSTAICGLLLRGLAIPAEILVGSEVSAFGGRSTLSLGSKYFVAETCEYRKHFLAFHPQRILLTSVESDHQDFFPTYESIRDAFLEYARLLPAEGELIYCADDEGACEVAGLLDKEKRGIKLIPYGFSALGDYKIESYEVRDEKIVMALASFPGELKISVPGKHNAQNAAGVIALVSSIVKKEYGGWTEERREALGKALEEFSGSRRRSEILGRAGGILFMDDYAHHPTELRTTLAGLREFYPNRRIIVSFMSHTFTRTAALLDDFASSFTDADIVLLHKIYASAREKYNGEVTALSLYEKVKEKINKDNVYYVEEPDESIALLKELLKEGDLFITMGAGDNFRMGKNLYNDFCMRQGS